MKKILVPTDFSPNATKALEFAVEIATRAYADLTLVYVADEVAVPFTDKTALEQKYNLPLEEAVQQEFELVKKTIREATQLEINTLLYGGPVVSSIMLAVKENNADMIIMGTLGDTVFKEKLFGSITAAVIGKATVPVLAVPLLSEWQVPRNILVAVNHFDEQVNEVLPVFELAALFNAKVTIAVFTDEDSDHATEYLEHSRNVMSYEAKLKDAFATADIQSGKLYGHKFEETLDEYIDENYIDILAMFTHKRKLAESIFSRSMTKKMSYHTNIPLLAIPVSEAYS